MGAQADCQSQLAGGSSAGSSSHCTQANKRNTGKDNQTFLSRQGTAVKHYSRFLVEIPPNISGTALQEHSSSHHTLSCQQTGAKPFLRPIHKPTSYTGFDSKGNEQICELLPKPNVAGMLEGQGRLPQTSPATHTTQQPQSNPDLPCSSHSSGPAWRKNRRKQSQTPRGPWKSPLPH